MSEQTVELGNIFEMHLAEQVHQAEMPGEDPLATSCLLCT